MAFYCMKSDFNRIRCIAKCEKSDTFCLFVVACVLWFDSV